MVYALEFPCVKEEGVQHVGRASYRRHYGRVRERIKAAYIDSSAFHRYDRKTMREEMRKAAERGAGVLGIPE